jgi:hypothetical protein
LIPATIGELSMALPERYVWLSEEGGPKMILKLLGTVEAAGFKGQSEDPRMGRGSRACKTYSHDSIPWCGLFPAPNDRKRLATRVKPAHVQDFMGHGNYKTTQKST